MAKAKTKATVSIRQLTGGKKWITLYKQNNI